MIYSTILLSSVIYEAVIYIKNISGGQTFADLAALDAAMAGGWAYGILAGRKTENGPLTDRYFFR